MSALDWDGLAKRVADHAATLDDEARARYLDRVRNLCMVGLMMNPKTQDAAVLFTVLTDPDELATMELDPRARDPFNV